MRAAVFKKPFKVETIDKEVPKVKTPTDVVVKVRFSGLCGSDLHYYRGHIPSCENLTMGHEFVGTIVEKGSEVSDEKFQIGDNVISTFTIQCGDCWYCKHGYTGTCDSLNVFGKVGLEGGQAEYVLVPFAKSTLIKLPQHASSVDDSIYLLMADVFVTAYYGVKKILDHYKGILDTAEIKVLQMGAGPVGLCATRILKQLGFTDMVVVDGIDERLEHAKRLGATHTVNFKSDGDSLNSLKASISKNRGFDAVLEITGVQSALKTSFEQVRRGGFISCVGMGHDDFPFNGLEAYGKCVTLSFGRCNTWALFQPALKLFDMVKNDLTDFIEVKCSIEEAGKYYSEFEKGEVGKVVFTF